MARARACVLAVVVLVAAATLAAAPASAGKAKFDTHRDEVWTALLDTESGVGSVALSPTASWLVSAGVKGFLGRSYHYANARQGLGNEATFFFDLPTPDVYEIFVSSTAHPNRAKNALYRIDNARNSAVDVVIDQTKASPRADGLYRLGAFEFYDGLKATVTLMGQSQSAATEFMVADTVAMRQGIVLDSEDSSLVTRTGGWAADTSTPANDKGFWGDNSFNSVSGLAASATFHIDVPFDEYYSVSLLSHGTAGPSSLPVVVNSADGASTVQVDFSVSGYHFLGSFRFEQGAASNVTVAVPSTETAAVNIDVLWLTGHEIIDTESGANRVQVVGDWGFSTNFDGFQGSHYRHDHNTGKGTKSITYSPDIARDGMYDIGLAFQSSGGSGRSSNVPVAITDGNGFTHRIQLDQTIKNLVGNFVSIGRYILHKGKVEVTISTAGTTQFVVADAIRLTYVRSVVIDTETTGTLAPRLLPATVTWRTSSGVDGFLGDHYHYSGASGARAVFPFFTAVFGLAQYEVLTGHTAHPNRDLAAQVTVTSPLYKGVTTTINQQQGGGQWHSVGGTIMGVLETDVTIARSQSNVIADAVQFRFVSTVPHTILESENPSDVAFTGAWKTSVSRVGEFYGALYHHNNKVKTNSAKFTFKTLPKAGAYELYLNHNSGGGRETKVPVTVVVGQVTRQVFVNQNVNPLMASLGQFLYAPGDVVSITIETAGTTGFVIVDSAFAILRQPICQAGEFRSLLTGRVVLECLPLTTCEVGFGQITAPTSTTDRKCEMCKAGFYKADNSATACTPCTAACRPGSFVAQACSTTGDLVCTPCLAGTYRGLGDSTCKPCKTSCPAPMVLQNQCGSPGSATDSSCVACPTGSFFNTQTSLCQTYKTCGRGEYRSTLGTAVADAVCSACRTCATGTYLSTVCTPLQNAVCASCPVCASNQYLDGACLSTATSATIGTCRACRTSCATCSGPSDLQCLSCPGGSPLAVDGACRGGCSKGSFVIPPATQCQACNTQCADCDGPAASDCLACSAGMFLDVSGTTRQCVTTCSAGSYGDTTTGTCKLCRACSATQKQTSACAPTQNTVCVEVTCVDGTSFRTLDQATGQATCKPCATCSTGQFISSSCTSVSNTRCVSCNGVSEFSPAATASQCSLVRTCVQGEFEAAGPTASTDRQCPKCAAGTSDHDALPATRCVVCSPGTYAAIGSVGPCTACPAGEADHDSDPATPCRACPTGTFSAQSSATACQALAVCGAGQEQQLDGTATANRQCIPCSLGTSYKASNATEDRCLPVMDCPAGSEETTPPTVTSNRRCTGCQAGFFKATLGQDPCVPFSVCRADEFRVDSTSPARDTLCEPLADVVLFFGEASRADLLANPSAFQDQVVAALGRAAFDVDTIRRVRSDAVATPPSVTVSSNQLDAEQQIAPLVASKSLSFSYNGEVVQPLTNQEAVAAQQASADSGGSSMLPIIIGAVCAVVIVALAVVAVYLYKKKAKRGTNGAASRSVEAVAFENPMYDSRTGEAVTNPVYEGDEGGVADGAYAEPAMLESGGGDAAVGYLDVAPPPPGDDAGYLDVTGFD